MVVRLSVLFLLLAFVLPALSQTPLTLNERIQAQEKIERVYYNHRIWPDSNKSKPSFEQMVPRSVIESKVIDSLKKSEMTSEMLQAEMDRIANTTQDPAMLRELYAALNNDPYLIAETLIRPILANRKNLVSSKMGMTKSSLKLPEINSGGTCEGWEVLNAPNPPSPRSGHTAVWTGAEMIIWGGAEQNTGGRYDPALNIWTPTSTGANLPSGRSDHTAIWTGTEMIIWGGVANSIETNTGGRYDPTSDTWTPTSIGANVADARSGPTAVWTGSEMIVWGGQICCFLELNTGGRYDPSSDSWKPTSIGMNLPEGRVDHSAVWTGQEMIIWGGLQGEFSLQTGGRYNPALDTWLPTSSVDSPTFRFDHTAVWTGSEMIVWGGRFYEFSPSTTNTGARYDPVSDTWQATPTLGAPLYRNEQTAVWTGTEMIIWSGNFYYWNMKSGGRYSLSGDSWLGTAIGPNVPEGRSEHTAIWTGTKMIVFGGYDSTSDLNTGGIYDPSTDYIALNPQALPNGEIGTPYFETISASGGASPYTMAMVEGTLPTGLTFDGSTGVISGTVTDEKAETPLFAINATDANLCAGGRSYYFFVCPVITFSPPTLPDGEAGIPYYQMITVSGSELFGSSSITAGTLPGGLTFDGSTGVISGTPTAIGTFNFTITFVDLISCTKSHDYTINITGPCLFCDDFEDGVLDPNWTVVKTSWNESGGSLNGTPDRKKAVIIATPIFSGCQTCFEESAMMTAGGIGNKIWMLGWYIDKQNTMELLFKEENDKIVLKQRSNGKIVTKAKGLITLNPNVSYIVRVAFDGTIFTVIVDNTPLFTLTPAAVVPTGTVGFQAKNTTGSFGYITVN